jgi:hypothetical protein
MTGRDLGRCGINPKATALRLTALQDGLAGTCDLTPEMAKAHLRRAFDLELG